MSTDSMRTSRLLRPVRRHRTVGGVMAAVGLMVALGCSDDPEGAVRAAGPDRGVDLAEATRSEVQDVTKVAVDEGTVLLGGVRVIAGDEGGEDVEPISAGVLVRPDGSTEDLPELPTEEPTLVLTATHRERTLFVTGVACTAGRTVDDTGQVWCDPGDLVLARLDIEAEAWDLLEPPSEAAVVDGEVHGITLAAFGDHLALTVPEPDGPARTWVARADDMAWRELPPVDGRVCAMGSDLVAVAQPPWPEDEEPLGPGETGTVLPMGEPELSDYALTVATLDREARQWGEPQPSPAVAAAPGSATGTCTPEGLVFLVVTGGGAGAVISYTPEGGFSVEERAGWGALASVVPTAGPAVVLEAIGSDVAVVVDPTTGGTSEVTLPPEASERVGSGPDGVLTLRVDGPPIYTSTS